MFPKQINLFHAPLTQYPPVKNHALPFSEYVNLCKTMIKNTRLDLDVAAPETIIEANAPFELRPIHSMHPTTGVLLIHGLMDSPFIMQDIGQSLAAQGMLVRAIILPGHGTIPGALLQVTYNDWLDTVRYGLESLRREVDRVYIIGFSTGGSLALYQTLQQAGLVQGLILVAPAIKIRSYFTFLAALIHKLNSYGLSYRWFHKDLTETLDCTKYLSLPFSAIYEVQRLAQHLKHLSHAQKIKCPILCIQSDADITVSSKACRTFFLRHANAQSHLIEYTPKEKAPPQDKRIIYRSSAYPNLNIVNFSHNCLLIKCDNPHYGRHGTYKYASHMDKNIIYGEFNPLHIKLKNMLYKLRLGHMQLQRLTFNPDYDYLAHQIIQFINQT